MDGGTRKGEIIYDKANSEFIRIGFKEYKKQFDLSTLGFSSRTADSVNKNNEKMYSMRQLDKTIDSLEKENKLMKEQTEKELFVSFSLPGFLDTVWAKEPVKDSIRGKKSKKF